ncbi:MAG: glycoside hydrolase family 97 catalytic domain-containing protein [Kiritimatiellae bacterium]|nr:glycoside hydrolase family 97 catalytic domain-containing protein [Kiritimatiellia bacterium]
MNKSLFLAAFAAAALPVCAEQILERSPDGRNEIRIDTDPVLTYSVYRDGKLRVAPTPISMSFEGKGAVGTSSLLKKPKVLSNQHGSRKAVLPTPIYKKAQVVDDGNETKVAFEGGWEVHLHARNDGVAYRFATVWTDPMVKVLDERGGLVLPSRDLTVYAGLTGGHASSWESIYTKTKVGALKDEQQKLCYLPLLVQYKDGVNLVVTESDLLDYPGWNLVADAQDPAKLNSSMAKFPDPAQVKDNQRQRQVGARFPYLAQTKGTRTYPWRVFILSDRPEKLVENDIVYALATPSRLEGDLSWIKPGKVAWEWWNCWNVYGKGVDFKAGCNTATYKHYIDFAAETGLEYVIMDEGWSVKLRIMEINPEIDVAELVRYGQKKGVGIILWCSWPQLVNRQDEVFQKYASLGVKGFKIDFMDRDDQFVVDFLERTAAIAAKYRLMVDYHGMYKPTGFHRTYPNIINYEGVHGLETAKFHKSWEMPGNDLKVVFTRMVAGPLDYTPGAMRHRARPLGDDGWPQRFDPKTAVFVPNWNQPDVQGTRVHQMALMSLYEAPLQMLCDSPSLYRENMECFKYMAAVPTTWDETVGLTGDVDRYAAVARRKGDVWYAAAIAGWDGAEIDLGTDFLGAGEWNAEIFEDGINAGRAPQDYVHRTIRVTAGLKIPVKMAPGGGFTVRFSRKPAWQVW